MLKEPEFADFIGAGLLLVDDLVNDTTLPALRNAYVRIRSVKHVLSPPSPVSDAHKISWQTNWLESCNVRSFIRVSDLVVLYELLFTPLTLAISYCVLARWTPSHYLHNFPLFKNLWKGTTSTVQWLGLIPAFCNKFGNPGLLHRKYSHSKSICTQVKHLTPSSHCLISIDIFGAKIYPVLRLSDLSYRIFLAQSCYIASYRTETVFNRTNMKC